MIYKELKITKKDVLFILFIFCFSSFFYILNIKNYFVSSVERGRYALIRAIVEDKSLRIDKYKDFSAPDLSMRNGHYYSRFPAGMSFMLSPFHFAANKIYPEKPYVVHFILLAIISALTINLFYVIGRLGDFSEELSLIVSLSFSFSTLIFSFSGGFWSHILSLFLITLSITSFLIFRRTKKMISILFFGLFYAISISIDFPNGIIIFPLFLFLIFNLIKLSKIKLFSGLILLLAPLIMVGSIIAVYNQNTFGSPFKIGQSAGASVGSTFKQNIVPLNSWNAQGVFDDRRLFPGLFSQTISPERGLLFFSPVLLLSLFGFWNFYKKQKYLSLTFLSVFLINIIFYSVWQDYWGGWSYGPRYLIASIPVLVLPLLYFLKYSAHRLLAEVLFVISTIWGIIINSLGAFSGSILPCPCEGYIGIWYSPLYALTRLNEALPNSFFYKNFLHDYINPYIFLLSIIGVLCISFLTLTYFLLGKENYNEV